jgi:hypothetical protein
MEERDYLMRLIAIFINALNRIRNCIESGDIEKAKIQINESYACLGASSKYFQNNSLETIITYFEGKEGDHLKRIQILSQLMYYDAVVQEKDFAKQQKLNKSIALLEYRNFNSEEYSFELNNLLGQMEDLLCSITDNRQ